MPNTAKRIGRDWLGIAATAYLAANLLHGADHLRQHLAGVDIEVLIGGFILTAAGVAVVISTRRHHPYAPLLATVVGFTAAALVAASHIAPYWSALSDSYINQIHPDAWSWAVVLLEITAGALLGVAGVYSMNARARGSDHDATMARGLEGADRTRTATLPEI
ncbi:MAG: hypothetical protein ACRENL_12415 [Candidatus Dormibacteria bacterium]